MEERGKGAGAFGSITRAASASPQRSRRCVARLMHEALGGAAAGMSGSGGTEEELGLCARDVGGELRVTDPIPLERMFQDWGMVEARPWTWFGNWRSGVERGSDWTTPEAWRWSFDVHRPEDWRGNHVLAWIVREWYAHLLQGPERVLDVGCQDGRPSLYVARYVKEVVGTDVDRVALARARRAAELGGGDNARFEVADAEKLPHGDRLRVWEGLSFMPLASRSDRTHPKQNRYEPRSRRQLYRVRV
jgi:hypothetical protein